MEEPGFPLPIDGTQKAQPPSLPSWVVGIQLLTLPGQIRFSATFGAPVTESMVKAGQVEMVGPQSFE